MEKKGSEYDIIYIVFGFFIVCITLLFVLKFMNSTNDQIQSLNIPQEAKDISISGLSLLHSFDYLLAAFFFGLIIITLILASLVRVHPVFIVFFVILLMIIIFMGGFLADTFQAIADNEALAGTAAQLPFIYYIFRWLPWLIGLFGGILCVVMYRNYNLAVQQ